MRTLLHILPLALTPCPSFFNPSSAINCSLQTNKQTPNPRFLYVCTFNAPTHSAPLTLLSIWKTSLGKAISKPWARVPTLSHATRISRVEWVSEPASNPAPIPTLPCAPKDPAFSLPLLSQEKLMSASHQDWRVQRYLASVLDILAKTLTSSALLFVSCFSNAKETCSLKQCSPHSPNSTYLPP